MINNLKLIVLGASIAFFASDNFHQTSTKESVTMVLLPDSTIKLDPETKLIVSEGLFLVKAHCTGCHSSKLITQFHSDKAGWLEKIRWMQQKQKLWDLGEAEPVILEYLSKNYPPLEKIDRRKNLKIKNWYPLKI